MKISTKTRTAWVSHPSDPSFRVQIRHLKRVQTFEYDQAILESQRITTLTDKEGAPLINPKSGEPYVYRVAILPPEKVVGFVAQFVLGWEGLKNDDDEPVPFSREALIHLLDEELDVRESDGEKATRTPFWQFLHVLAINPGTFDIDPFTARSGGQPTA